MRIIWLLVLITASLTLPWYVFVCGVFLYSFVYEGLEVLIVAWLLDAYAGYTVPWVPIPAVYTIATTGILVLIWGLKPLFLIESRVE